MEPADLTATFCATVVDEWVRAGLSHAVVCPGSRSTPMALALAARSEIALAVQPDERSGGFMALGAGKVSGHPALVLTTSGTAAAELHPAVVEADLAGVPLLVCTADRPPELRDVAAAQTIDQVRLYGGAPRWFSDPGPAVGLPSERWRPWAARAIAATTGRRPGPVHVNLALREPLVGRAGALPPGRPDGGPWSLAMRAAVGASSPSPDLWATVGAPGVAASGSGLGSLVGERFARRRGVIVAGSGSGSPERVEALATALGWPVLADATAPARRGSPVVVAHADVVLRAPLTAARLAPEVVLRLGGQPASRVLGEWLAASGAFEVVVAGAGVWADPDGTAAVVVDASVDEALAEWLAALSSLRPPAPDVAGRRGAGGARGGRGAEGTKGEDRAQGRTDPLPVAAPAKWLTTWRNVDAAAGAAIDAALARHGPGEPTVARATSGALAEGSVLVVSSSMPIRDLEWYAPPRAGLEVLANRGANGIDGVVSTAVGVAWTGRRTALLIGDLALIHDSNGLLGAAGRDLDLVVVVIDNDGGGIFSMLAQASSVDRGVFEPLFGTPHGLDLAALLEARRVPTTVVGPDARSVGTAVAAAQAAGGVRAVLVRTSRSANAALHRALGAAVVAVLDKRS